MNRLLSPSLTNSRIAILALFCLTHSFFLASAASEETSEKNGVEKAVTSNEETLKDTAVKEVNVQKADEQQTVEEKKPEQKTESTTKKLTNSSTETDDDSAEEEVEEPMEVHALPSDDEEAILLDDELEEEDEIKDGVKDGVKDEEESAPTQNENLTTPKRETLGWIERMALVNGDELLLLDAKMSVGTSGNQLHAEDISVIKSKKKNGKKKVRFVINTRDGRSLEIVAKYSGSVKRDNKKRYTVHLPVCIGKKYMELDFQLANRSSFEHEVRIGRDALAGHYVVDPAKTKTVRPACSK